jgi:hypothetical protein
VELEGVVNRTGERRARFVFRRAKVSARQAVLAVCAVKLPGLERDHCPEAAG